MWRLPRLPLVFWLIKILINIIVFLFVDIKLSLAQVLSFILIFLAHFSEVDLNGSMTSSMIFLIIFLFFESLSLELTYINRRAIVGLNFILVPILILSISLVFIFICSRFIVLQTFKVDFLSLNGSL